MLASAKIGATLLVLTALSGQDAEGGSVTTPGRVTEVTVFQGQALVTRLVELPDGEGLVEAVVTDLPDRLLPGSLYAEPGEGVEVRSVRTRLRPTESAPREEVQQLEERIAELERRLQTLARERDTLTQREEYIAQLENFTSGTAREELKSGVLDAGTLRELTELVFNERERASRRKLEIEFELKELESQRDLARRELKTLTGGADRTTREAVVFLQKDAGAATVRLRYLVAGASWSPSYNVRAKEDRSGVTLEYNASVTQMSGEDWTDVAMTLSTATPSLVASAPKLEPLTVSLVSAIARDQPGGRKSKLALSQEQRELASNRGNFYFDAFNDESDGVVAGESLFGKPASGGFGAVYANEPEAVARWDIQINALACATQVIDLQQGGEWRSTTTNDDISSSEGISVVYRLPNKTSLPSRSDKQLIQVAALPLDADFYRVASPVLTDYVYQEAKLTNATKHVLLAGPAATFLGDRFVGRGSIPQAAIGESFTVGLGIDESLSASRELVDKSDRVQGGNRVATFEYRLTIENFGAKAIPVRVLDRLPNAQGEAIKVSLLESDPEAIERDDDGLLRWDLDAPAGGDASVTYTMTLEHDKNLRIVGGGK